MRPIICLLLGFLLTQFSCNTNSSPSTQPNNLTIKLIDSPAFFDQEVIVIRRMELHRVGASSDLGWRVITENLATCDLLKFRNGVNQVIVSTVVPPGNYDAIQLVLEGSYVVIGGQYILLDLPKGVAGGYVIQYPLDIADNNFYELILDFDAYRSIKQTGVGQYQLNPVLRIQDASIAGSISGAVVSATDLKPVNCLISTSVGTDSVATASDLTNGSFLLGALPEGSYGITISSVDSVFKDTTISHIQVLRQRQTPIGAIGVLPR